jgi:hypothetical protein
MSTITVELDEREWQAAMGLIALGPWREANPLLMKIGAQLQAQDVSGARQTPPLSGNTREAGHG